ncbi:MAG: PQQ-binding-like beta-propeller repeat protein, partial [Bacteroidetes Order II. Incertae sedis bacterium]|nr:PQQ-binding-like beta-propeller repeat protein [Bacteroidetes Order II. bacterium]
MSKNFFFPLLFLFFTSAGCDVNNEGKVISSDGLTLKNLWRQSKVEKKNTLLITYGVRKRPPLQPDGVFTFGDISTNDSDKRPMMLDRATGRIKWKADDEAIVWGANSVHQHGDIVLLHETDRLIALDLKTGKTKWKKKRERRDSGNDNWGSLNVHGLGGIYFTAH